MNHLSNLQYAICEVPTDDTPRLVFADALEDVAAKIQCPDCNGTGKPRPSESQYSCSGCKQPSGMYGHYSTTKQMMVCPPPVPCGKCEGRGVVSNGLVEWAEFIRLDVRWSRRTLGDCTRPKTWCNHEYLEPWAHSADCPIGQMHNRRTELMNEHGKTWFGPHATLRGPERAEMHEVEVLGRNRQWLVVDRGFPKAWYGSLETFTSQPNCVTCNGRGGYQWDHGNGNVDEGTCDDCHGQGRIFDFAKNLSRYPIEFVSILDAVIWPSGGNDTCYLGGLGAFPSHYWRELDNHLTQANCRKALQNVCLTWLQELREQRP